MSLISVPFFKEMVALRLLTSSSYEILSIFIIISFFDDDMFPSVIVL